MLRALLLLLVPTLLAQSAPDFERDIRPLLAANTLSCHNEKSKASGSALTWLPKALRHEDGLQMPPGRQLPAADIAKVEAWLAAGALWPAAAPASIQPAKEDHRAFQPLRPGTLTSIDQFIQARLQRESLRPLPLPTASPNSARVSLDLTGLPPDPAEAQPYEAVVDRLLTSPQLSERWARQWLDQARYADALNRNRPFDQFIIEQLAGDLLPNATPDQLIATGFHRNSLL